MYEIEGDTFLEETAKKAKQDADGDNFFENQAGNRTGMELGRGGLSDICQILDRFGVSKGEAVRYMLDIGHVWG